MSRFYGTVSMAAAARILGTNRAQLFRQLREAGHFDGSNTPRRELRQEGYFRLETRGFHHPGLGREVQYQRVRVTPAGLHWLEGWLEERPTKKRAN